MGGFPFAFGALGVFSFEPWGCCTEHPDMIDDSIEDELDSELERESLFLRDAHNRLESQFSENSMFDEEGGDDGGQSFEPDNGGAFNDFSGVEDEPQSVLLGAAAKAKPSPPASSSGLTDSSVTANFNSDIVFGTCIELS